MLIGAMNHPGRSLPQQIRWLGQTGFDFLDLTLEPPEAASWNIDVPAIKGMLEAFSLRVVGHTAPFLPIASPVEELRRAALFEFCRCVDVFQRLGASWMNVHPGASPMHNRAFTVEQNLKSLQELVAYGRNAGVGVMIENLPGQFNTAQELSELLDPLPELGLHLDIGHANLMTPANTTNEIVAAYGERLRHVHLHDNRGGHLDLHLPLGAGDIDLAESLRTLTSCGYDATITLEVFSTDPNHLLRSRDLLRQAWAVSNEEIA
jgi:sugar phosphate isomerase/epimerase